jgi:hypothetical protein
MADITIRVPDQDAPGFLGRQLRALEILEYMGGKMTTAKLKSMIEFTLDYVQEPADREEARRILMDELSEQEFNDIITSIAAAGGSESTIPPESAPTS